MILRHGWCKSRAVGCGSYSCCTNSTLRLTVQSAVLGTRIGCATAVAAFLWCLSRRRFIWSINEANLCGSFSLLRHHFAKLAKPSGSSGSATSIFLLLDDYLSLNTRFYFPKQYRRYVRRTFVPNWEGERKSIVKKVQTAVSEFCTL